VNDLVWVSRPVDKHHVVDKSFPQTNYFGPQQVITIITNIYFLKDLKTGLINPYDVSRLKPYQQNPSRPFSLNDIIDASSEPPREISGVLDHVQLGNCIYYYLIYSDGSPPSWVQDKHIGHLPVVREYNQRVQEVTATVNH
jgi:hypothetical protein